MSTVVREAGPWIFLTVTLIVIYRWCKWQDTKEMSAEARYRQRMADRYYQWEFEVEPLEPRVYDFEQEDAA